MAKRPPHSKKKGIKGMKSQRGVPETLYGEAKEIFPIRLTKTALERFNDCARTLKISNSELLERIIRMGPELKRLICLAIEEHQSDHSPPKKRMKNIRGVPANPFREKKSDTSFSLTPTAYKRLNDLSQALGIEMTSTLEYIVRSDVLSHSLPPPKSNPSD